MRKPSAPPKAVIDKAESEALRLTNFDGFIHQGIIGIIFLEGIHKA
jgi:hypothetical protein